MSLRMRLAAIVIPVMLLLLGLYAAIFVYVALPRFGELEHQTVELNRKRVLNTIRHETSNIDLFVVDWAQWDDTYFFVEDRNPTYIERNLVPELFASTRMNLILILDRQGRQVWGGARDLETDTELAFPEFPPAGLPSEHPLLVQGGPEAAVAGLYATAHGPMMLTARPILTSTGEGPARGTFIMGRLLGAEATRRLSEVIQLPLTVWPLPAVPTSEQPALGALVTAPLRHVQPVGGDRLHVYTLLDDVLGRPVALARFAMGRELLLSGRETVLLALGVAGAGGLVTIAVVMLLVEGLIVRPLAELNRLVGRLRGAPAATARLAYDRGDEIGGLAAAFDRLLVSLSQAAGEQEKARSRLIDGIESIEDGFALWDAEDRLVVCNEKFIALFPMVADESRAGVVFTELIRTACRRGQLAVAASEAEDWIARRRAQHRRPGQPINYRLGDGRWIEIGERRTKDGGIVGIYTDITARRAAAEDLERMVTELERSNSELEQFAYVASHDLQEPLRMVASYTQLIERRYRGRLDADADEFIHFAVDGARRMQGLIDDLLAYSRVDRKGRPLESADARQAVEAALRNLRAAVAESGATVTVAALPTVRADFGQLVQLFQNLIGNALKYREPERPATIAVAAERAAEGWCFTVRDNGIGIDAAFHDRIFLIFQRLHTRDQYPGTGIGLAVCKKIVERHGGHITVESVPGQGSLFKFTLPDPDPEDALHRRTG